MLFMVCDVAGGNGNGGVNMPYLYMQTIGALELWKKCKTKGSNLAIGRNLGGTVNFNNSTETEGNMRAFFLLLLFGWTKKNVKGLHCTLDA